MTNDEKTHKIAIPSISDVSVFMGTAQKYHQISIVKQLTTHFFVVDKTQQKYYTINLHKLKTTCVFDLYFECGKMSIS